MCKETEFVEKATKIIFNGCRESMARVKEGDTIVIDDKYKHDYGDFHKWRAGDEFRVTRVVHTPFFTSVYCVATKAPSDGDNTVRTVRGEVGAKTEFHDKMPLFEYLRIKGDLTVRNNLRQLCRDYLDGLM